MVDMMGKENYEHQKDRSLRDTFEMGSLTDKFNVRFNI